MTTTSRRSNEQGMAIITALLVLMLASGLMAGMYAALIADQRSHATDRDQSQAYAAAHAGLEKLTAALGYLFTTDFSPSAAQLDVLDNTPPSVPGFAYTAPGGAVGSGYQISFTPDPGPGPNTGNPAISPNLDITTGPFAGLKGLITPYVLTVTAKSTTGNSEVRLRREVQTVAVPVFQFGIFGEKTIGFHAGPNFDFGGRVHTNESLYLAEGGGNTLTFRDKITAFVQVVRNTLMNGSAITATGHSGNVSIPTVIGGPPASYRNLADTESSGTTAAPWSGWKNLSEVTYATNIRTEATGAKALRLPLVDQGAVPIDLVKRPAVNSNENVANPAVFGQRLFSQASLRILLSDRAADITNLPTVTAAAPLQLDAAGGPAGYVVGAGRPPVAAAAPDPVTAGVFTRVSAIAGTTLTIQSAAAAGGPWNNVMPDWLRLPAVGAQPVNTIVVSPGGVPSNKVCAGVITATQFQGCPAAPAGGYAAGTQVTRVTPEGLTILTTINPAVAAGATTYTVVSTARFTAATRYFFVGEDPVTCSGINGNTLTGCTWGAGTLAVNDPAYLGSTVAAGTPLLHGFIKIEKQNAAGVWSDVTLELLNLGFAGANQAGAACADPTPNAVIRLQRLRDSGLGAGGCAGQANYSTSLNAADFWPNNLFDARESGTRLVATTAGMNLGGVFSYVALDVANLRRWFAGAIGATGAQALNNNGYIVYFSDRRGDHNETIAGDPETGEYGNEDSINTANAVWAKDNVLNAGEDFNENNTLQTYGETPHSLVYGGAVWPAIVQDPAGAPFNDMARPWTNIPLLYSGRGLLARQVLFRRALKLVNGGLVGAVNNLPAAGFTVAAENPVYVQGDYNANGAVVPNATWSNQEPNVPAAIMADSITLLSNSWTDMLGFRNPNNAAVRTANTDTSYRFAMITGKSVPFAKPAGWGDVELGADGGVHNFMKMLENWGGRNLRYRGSMVSLYYSRQAIGIYRADANVYSPPTRGYNFDTDFLTPALLPPGTPMFRDINTLKFRQILRPNQ